MFEKIFEAIFIRPLERALKKKAVKWKTTEEKLIIWSIFKAIKVNAKALK